MQLPCGDSADARYCPKFWEVSAERDDFRTLLERLADAAERCDQDGSAHIADLRAEIASARRALAEGASISGDDAGEPVKPVVIVFDINEGIQGWFRELTEAVYDQSGERVVITEIDAGMSDVMIAVADRQVSTDEAIAIWHATDGDPQ